jgi:DNA-binding transcriptional LysR family regulator
MPLRLPPLPALRLFEAAGWLSSFKLAAEELGITPSAVSHGILGLEEWLGVALFLRGRRGLSLSREGTDYLPYISEALSMIAVGTQRMPSGRPDRTIVVSCAPTFASRWLLPRLHRFRERSPKVGVSIDTAQRQVGFPIDGVDLAIRLGRGPWPGLASTRLLGERLVPVCAPAYRDKLTRAGGASDLKKATLIHLVTATDDWSSWLTAADAGELDLSAGLRFDTIQLAFEAAAAGLGVAIGRLLLVQPELACGTLVPLSDIVVESSTAYWLVGSDAVETRPDLTAFVRWLNEEIAAAQQAELVGVAGER